jgi:hypothetical protein
VTARLTPGSSRQLVPQMGFNRINVYPNDRIAVSPVLMSCGRLTELEHHR